MRVTDILAGGVGGVTFFVIWLWMMIQWLTQGVS